MVKARNAGEANWAKKQGKSFKDQRTREQFRTKVGFRHNSQKREWIFLPIAKLTNRLQGPSS